MTSLKLSQAELLCMLMEEDSEEEKFIEEIIIGNSDDESTRRRGSRPGKKANIDRERLLGNQRLLRDYFIPNCTYPELIFRRRYRMSSLLFERIRLDLEEYDSYFVTKIDALGVVGLSSHQKITAAFRMLMYGIAADTTDEYLRISETTALQSLKKTCTAILAVYGDEYLRSPTVEELKNYMEINEKRGFPGMFGSLDCTHWNWKNCPMGYAGAYQDRGGNCSIILEAIATQDLRIWHAFFGMPGSCNDINVLDRSPLLLEYVREYSQRINFSINGQDYHQPYFLVDGIYPPLSNFVQTISQPQGEKRSYFVKMQEAVRKDVERCFGVLQARFSIIKQPCRLWSSSTMKEVMQACITLHNMIIEDDKLAGVHPTEVEGYIDVLSTTTTQITELMDISVDHFCNSISSLNDVKSHHQLRNDLIEHLWARKGNM